MSRISRRQAIALGLTGLTLPHVAHAQASPAASPTSRQPATMLVDPAWVTAQGHDPTRVAFMSEKEAGPGVIPGSTRLDWPDLEVKDTTPEGLSAWVTSLTSRLPEAGILPMKPTLAYDAGSLFAARLWWVLQATGHRDAQVLDGGLPSWTSAGNADLTAPEPGFTVDGEGMLTLDLTMIAPIADVEGAVGAPDVTFIDARAPEEYAKGHIPGAVNIPYPKNARSDSPHTWLPTTDLESLYTAIPSDHTVIPYCSSGVRSAVTAFTLRLIGYERVRLFTGSWNEWSQDPARPITTGMQP